MKINNRKGFTLIEILVVIAIVGLLSTLATSAFGSARSKSRDTKRLNDIKQIQNSLELFYSDWEYYPTSTGIILGNDDYNCLAAPGFMPAVSCPVKYYMNGVPKDPFNGQYIYYGDIKSYEIVFTLESGSGGYGAGIVTATPAGLQGIKQ